MVVVVGAWVVVVVGAVAVVVGADDGSAIVGMSNDASCVSGAWEADTRNSPPTRSMITAAGLVRRSVQRRCICGIRPSRCCGEESLGELFDSRLPNPFGTARPFVGECRVRDGAAGSGSVQPPAVTLLFPQEQGESRRCGCWSSRTRRQLAAGLRDGLEAEGFAVDVAGDGTDGLWMAREHPYDAIVLDIMLPGLNGYRVCADPARRKAIWTPILMLTAKDGELRRGRGARHRRRRLPHQAVLLRRAPGPPAGAAAPGRAGAARRPRGRRPPARPGHPAGVAGRRRRSS